MNENMPTQENTKKITVRFLNAADGKPMESMEANLIELKLNASGEPVAIFQPEGQDPAYADWNSERKQWEALPR